MITRTKIQALISEDEAQKLDAYAKERKVSRPEAVKELLQTSLRVLALQEDPDPRHGRRGHFHQWTELGEDEEGPRFACYCGLFGRLKITDGDPNHDHDLIPLRGPSPNRPSRCLCGASAEIIEEEK